MNVALLIRHLIVAVILVILFYGIVIAAGFITSLVGVVMTALTSIAVAFVVVRISNRHKYQNDYYNNDKNNHFNA